MYSCIFPSSSVIVLQPPITTLPAMITRGYHPFRNIVLTLLLAVCAQPLLHAQSIRWELQDSLVITYVPGFPATASFSSIDCSDSLNCIATGAVGNVYSLIHTTTDGGKHWKTVILDSAEISPVVKVALRLKTIKFLTPTTALIITDSGAVLRTSDAGITWNRIETGTKSNLEALSVFDPAHIAVMGYQKTVIISSDSGKTWKILPSPSDSASSQWGVGGIALTSPKSMALTLGYGDTSGIYLNEDISKPWPNPQPFISTHRLFFLNKQDGWAVGRKAFGPAHNAYDIIRRTYDGGKTWETVVNDSIYPAYGLTVIKFLDDQHGVAIGFFGKVLLTHDGGKTWKPNSIVAPKTNFIEFAYPTKNHIWIATVFGQIFHGTISETSDVRSENSNQTTAAIIPNPADKRAVLLLEPSEQELHSISIVDALGKQWLSLSKDEVIMNNSQILLNTETLPAGQYFVSIHKGDTIQTLPLTIVQ